MQDIVSPLNSGLDGTYPSSYHAHYSKRLLDWLLILACLPLVLLVFTLCLLLISITMGPPVIYSQERIGKGGKPFVMYKFRTMKRKFKGGQGHRHSKQDITRFGRFLRFFRWDELPQIWNIMRGEMSWIGPRPEIPFYVDQFSTEEQQYAQRHCVRPGITGLAQINYPNATPNDFRSKLPYDLAYVAEASLTGDLKILFRSFLAIWS